MDYTAAGLIVVVAAAAAAAAAAANYYSRNTLVNHGNQGGKAGSEQSISYDQ